MPRFNDLTGKTFNRLKVVRKYDKKYNKTRWLCKCECGNEVIVTTCNLTSGHSQSCGCARKLAQLKDISGQRFGRLTAIRYVDSRKGKSYWECQCDCGNIKTVSISNLQNGYVRSCGCYNRECLSNRAKHGDSNTHLYKEWTMMKDRVRHREDYISKNRTVCQEWDESYESFRDWALSHGYEYGLSLDRIDNSKGYSPDNCRWANRVTQNRNKDNNIKISYKGETHIISEWAEILNMSYGTFYSRIRRGWSIEDAIEKPLRKWA